MTAKIRSYPYLLGGKLQRTGKPFDVINPYDGSVVGRAHKVSEATIEEAVASTAGAINIMTLARERLADDLLARRHAL